VTQLRRVSGRECVSALEKAGFYKKRQHGSHIIMRRDEPFAQVVVPDHKELDRGTLRAIIRQAGLTVEQFNERKQIVEHPYATIKHWMGSTHFLMKRLPNVQTEMSLHVLAYNLRRAINILGVPKIIAQLQTA
jgi:predicted RNA binding protein YcfA (HicA-like mRNA interferase family)